MNGLIIFVLLNLLITTVCLVHVYYSRVEINEKLRVISNQTALIPPTSNRQETLIGQVIDTKDAVLAIKTELNYNRQCSPQYKDSCE